MMTRVSSPPGEIRRDPDGGRTLVFRRRYSEAVEEVWSAVTESDRLARWFGRYEGAAVLGGTVVLTMTSAEDAGGDPSTVHIVECRPPHRLVVDIFEADQQSWRIALTLAREAGATTLVFEQAVPPEMDPADVGCGWHWYLDRLAAALVGAAMPSWPDYFPALVSAYRDSQSP